MKQGCRESKALRRALVGAWMAVGLAAGPVVAQGIEFTAEPAPSWNRAPATEPLPGQQPVAEPLPVQSGPVPTDRVAVPEPAPAASDPAVVPEMTEVKMTPGPQVVQAFVEACVDHGGAVAPAVDWALNHGFEPLDPEGRDGTDGHALLGGQPGVVFATPDPATRVLLAVTQDNSCTVWAERAAGTSTQDAFMQAAEALAIRGVEVRRETDRMLERAGAWRRQLEYRLRPVPGGRDYRLGAVTTLTESPAAQALHLAPVQPPQVSSASAEVQPQAVRPAR